MKETHKEQKMIEALAKALDRYNVFIQRSYKIGADYIPLDRKGKCEEVYHFGFIPINTETIIEALSTVYDKINKACPTFLDIGCGIGNVVQIASGIGFYAYGLEYNTRIYNIAIKLVDGFGCSIIKGDMLKFEQYHKYDVLYYYQPIGNRDLMYKFSKKLAKEMKLGAYVIPYGASAAFQANKFFQPITGTTRGIFKKIRMLS